jgi:hypothetical protein
VRIISIYTMDPKKSGKEPSQEQFEKMGALIAEFQSKGILIDTGGHSPDMLELRVTRNTGSTTVTDGPFTESKEVVGGYALMEVKDRDEAIALTKRFLDVAGDGTCTIHEVSTV